MLLNRAKQQFHHWIGEPSPKGNPRLREDRAVVHIGRRAHCRAVKIGGKPHLKKVFTTETAGRLGFASERLAARTLAHLPWFTPWVRRGLYSFTGPLYPAESRLDRVAPELTPEQRLDLAGQALSIILDLLVLGLAHRDFHARNLFVVDGQLRLIDYETLARYVDGHRPGLDESYDVTGRGMESPWLTGNMGYSTAAPISLSTVLGIDFEAAKAQLAIMLKRELLEASLTFNKAHGRHVCRQGRIYNTVDLPGFVVGPNEAQRDCSRRFARFGIHADVVRGTRVLDLGSNIGGMLFEAQRYLPFECLGLEFDPPKVRVSQRVAAFAGLRNVQFVHGDVERASVRSLRGPYDVVLCLAVVEHLRKPRRLYELLGRITRNVLYFEGNSKTKASDAEACLRSAGFSRVEHLGMCDDDSLAENNRRPMFRAFK